MLPFFSPLCLSVNTSFACNISAEKQKSNGKSAFLNICCNKNGRLSRFAEPGLSGRSFMRRLICQRMCAVEGVAARCAVRVSGGRYNIDPDYQLGKPFITTKLLFYDNIFHHAAERLFVGTAAGDIIGEFFDEVRASVQTECRE